MALKASEISELLKQRIKNFESAAEARDVGTVIAVTDGICRENAHPADGIDDFRLDDGVNGRHGGILGAGHAAGP